MTSAISNSTQSQNLEILKTTENTTESKIMRFAREKGLIYEKEPNIKGSKFNTGALVLNENGSVSVTYAPKINAQIVAIYPHENRKKGMVAIIKY